MKLYRSEFYEVHLSAVAVVSVCFSCDLVGLNNKFMFVLNL